MSDLQEGLKAWERRNRARRMYRRIRDQRIATDLIGKEFEYGYTDQLTGNKEWLRIRLIAYDPDTHLVRIRPLWTDAPAFVWDTDAFWSMKRIGIVRDA